MSYVNPETGELIDSKALLILDQHPEHDRWGDVVSAALSKVTAGPHYRKKRATLLKLAEHAFENLPQNPIWKIEHCGSRQAHAKWLGNDPDYAAAYTIMVGTITEPGVARLQRAEIIDEAEDLAITALADARAQLRVASSQAVQTLIDGLSAANRYGPKWHERIMAANSILDRADPETAGQQVPAQVAIDKAIMHVYGISPAGLPSIAGSRGYDDTGEGAHIIDHKNDGDITLIPEAADTPGEASEGEGQAPAVPGHSDDEAISDLLTVIEQAGAPLSDDDR